MQHHARAFVVRYQTGNATANRSSGSLLDTFGERYSGRLQRVPTERVDAEASVAVQQVATSDQWQ